MIDQRPAEEPGTSQGATLLFLAELEHRVVNEYAVAVSTISAAATRSSSPEARATLTDAATRLRDYAAAHRALQAPTTVGLLDLADYLRRLCAARARAGLYERGIQLLLIEEAVDLDAQRCWRVGLIVSELITNSMRHAFGRDYSGTDPEIVVELTTERDGIRVRVSDNGGAAPGEPSRGRGGSIVDALVADLQGELMRSFGEHGSSVLLWIPA
jgi:two-component sensor histidine kinase